MEMLNTHVMPTGVGTTIFTKPHAKCPSLRNSPKTLALLLILVAALFATPALAKNRPGGKLFYTGINLGASSTYDSDTVEGMAYNWGGSFKYIKNRAFGYGLTYNTSNYAYKAIDDSDLETTITTTTVDIIIPLDFIHYMFDIYYSRAAIYSAANFGVAKQSVLRNGKKLALGADENGFAAGASLGMLYCFDLDRIRRQTKFGGLTIGGEVRFLKFIAMDASSGEAQLNFTIGYSF